MTSTPYTDHYSVLGVDNDATEDEIRQQYLRQSLLWHPDKCDNGDLNLKRKHTEKFTQICDSYAVLKDGSTRKKYDAERSAEQQTYPIHMEIDLDQMSFDEDTQLYSYPCRCEGSYVVSEIDLEQGVEAFGCGACTLCIRVLYEEASDYEVDDNDDDDDDNDNGNNDNGDHDDDVNGDHDDDGDKDIDNHGNNNNDNDNDDNNNDNDSNAKNIKNDNRSNDDTDEIVAGTAAATINN